MHTQTTCIWTLHAYTFLRLGINKGITTQQQQQNNTTLKPIIKAPLDFLQIHTTHTQDLYNIYYNFTASQLILPLRERKIIKKTENKKHNKY